ncbi:MAG: sigma-70 family RNA polymerase sigma factor [Polyangiales bacterium]
MHETQSRNHHDIPLLMRRAQKAPLLDSETERKLIAEAQEGSKRAVEKLVLSHLRIVFSVARHYRRVGIPMDDLVSEGTLGLMEAIRRFDLGRDNRFGTYAAWWVQARLRRYAAATRHLVAPPSTRNARKILRSFERTSRAISQRLGRPALRHEIAEALDVTVEDVAMVEPVLRATDARLGPTDEGVAMDLPGFEPSPEQEVEARELATRRKACIERAFRDLTPRERIIVERRLLDEDGDSLSTLGEEFGVSRERVRQVQHQVQNKLRARLGEAAAWY